MLIPTAAVSLERRTIVARLSTDIRINEEIEAAIEEACCSLQIEVNPEIERQLIQDVRLNLPRLLQIAAITAILPQIEKKAKGFYIAKLNGMGHRAATQAADDLDGAMSEKILTAFYGRWPKKNPWGWVTRIRQHTLIDLVRHQRRSSKAMHERLKYEHNKFDERLQDRLKKTLDVIEELIEIADARTKVIVEKFLDNERLSEIAECLHISERELRDLLRSYARPLSSGD